MTIATATTHPNGHATADSSEVGRSVAFFHSLFVPGDRVLIRPVETWTDSAGKKSRVDFKGVTYLLVGMQDSNGQWQPDPARLEGSLQRIFARARIEKTNVFFGVCPRLGGRGQFDKAWQIRTVRALWSDVDHCSPTEVAGRIDQAKLPKPSSIVNSGNGCHVYWLLADPYLIDDCGAPPKCCEEWIDTPGDRRRRREYVVDQATGEKLYLDARQNVPELSARALHIQDVISGVAAAIGGDSTSDLSRLLRVPEFPNQKDARSGRTPVPCELVETHPERVYPLSDFERFVADSPARKRREQVKQIPLPGRKRSSERRRQQLELLLADCAAADVGQRSGADFALCCYAVEHGLSAAELWERCGSIGKFAERGRPYFDLTWQAAEAHTREKTFEKSRAQKASRPKPEPSDNQAERPRIDAGRQDIRDLSPVVWEAVQAANDPPYIFRRGGRPVRIESGDDAEPVLKTLDFYRARYELTRVADWYRQKADEEIPSSPSKEIVEDFLATPDMDLPVLNRIVEAPVFAPDGSIQTTPGYHRRSKTFYAPAKGFHVPEVSARPTAEEIAEARRLYEVELLGDFPFISDSERTHGIGMALLPFVRDMIEGSTPFHLVEKPTAGTGSTLLVDVLAHPAIGRPIPAMTEGRDEDEWRKRLTAKFRESAQFVLIDNLKRRLESAALASGVTSPMWEDRVLSTSEMVRIPVRSVFVATGNNPSLGSEIARRTVRIRMDSRTDRPWLRSGFRHPNLRAWTAANRGRLVWGALTLAQAWIVAGKPTGDVTPLGMFESWSEVMGGIFAVAGIPGFLENLESFYDETDAEGTVWRAFLAAWWERFGDHAVKVSELYSELKDEISLPVKDGGEQSQKVQLGQRIAEMRDRVFDVETGQENCWLRIQRGEKHQRAYTWKLRKEGKQGNAVIGECTESSESPVRGLRNQISSEEKNTSYREAFGETQQTQQTHQDSSGNGHACPACGSALRDTESMGVVRRSCPACGRFIGYVQQGAA